MSEGISFIVRIRDEEETLYESIKSLSSLKIPHEIILILHLCTDNSPQIAKNLAIENANVRVIYYDKEVSRAGYETLATDVDSDHSFVKYMNWCIKKARYPWIFKWDADFSLSDPLLHFLNENTWENKNIDYKITHKNEECSGKEYYLLSGLIKYVKHIFWEAPLMKINHVEIPLNEDIYIKHISSLKKLKSYWNEKPWYEKENSEEVVIVKNRIKQLNDDFGKEPLGMARACNAECDKYNFNIFYNKPSYVNLYS